MWIVKKACLFVQRPSLQNFGFFSRIADPLKITVSLCSVLKEMEAVKIIYAQNTIRTPNISDLICFKPQIPNLTCISNPDISLLKHN